jgi:putative endonuclease
MPKWRRRVSWTSRTEVNRRQLGATGETAAAQFLAAKGYEIIDRNVRFRVGELDLIARDGETLVFVEVKTRLSHRVGTGEEAITPAKQRQLVRLAELYLAAMGGPQPLCRFDVVIVTAAAGGWQCHHLPHAFLGSSW